MFIYTYIYRERDVYIHYNTFDVCIYIYIYT